MNARARTTSFGWLQRASLAACRFGPRRRTRRTRHGGQHDRESLRRAEVPRTAHQPHVWPPARVATDSLSETNLAARLLTYFCGAAPRRHTGDRSPSAPTALGRARARVTIESVCRPAIRRTTSHQRRGRNRTGVALLRAAAALPDEYGRRRTGRLARADEEGGHHRLPERRAEQRRQLDVAHPHACRDDQQR